MGKEIKPRVGSEPPISADSKHFQQAWNCLLEINDTIDFEKFKNQLTHSLDLAQELTERATSFVELLAGCSELSEEYVQQIKNTIADLPSELHDKARERLLERFNKLIPQSCKDWSVLKGELINISNDINACGDLLACLESYANLKCQQSSPVPNLGRILEEMIRVATIRLKGQYQLFAELHKVLVYYYDGLVKYEKGKNGKKFIFTLNAQINMATTILKMSTDEFLQKKVKEIIQVLLAEAIGIVPLVSETFVDAEYQSLQPQLQQSISTAGLYCQQPAETEPGCFGSLHSISEYFQSFFYCGAGESQQDQTHDDNILPAKLPLGIHN